MSPVKTLACGRKREQRERGQAREGLGERENEWERMGEGGDSCEKTVGERGQ